MTIKYKIFRLTYDSQVTFDGYSDGYGKEHIYHPIFKAAEGGFGQSDEWDTKQDAEKAIELYGSNGHEYVIQKVYYKPYI